MGLSRSRERLWLQLLTPTDAVMSPLYVRKLIWGKNTRCLFKLTDKKSTISVTQHASLNFVSITTGLVPGTRRQ